MPPFQSRSTGARRTALISSAGGSGVRLHAERAPHLGRERDRLGRAGEDAATGRDQRRVVIGPRRPGQVEQPLPLGERSRPGPGSGSRNTWRWSKAATSLRAREQQHAVAEHVARHVADADDGDGGRVGVDAEVAEVAAHRLPGALGGDAHLLVVVARRTAGGEGVAQPEAVLGGDGVGQVGERGRALVGRHHEVGVVAVVGVRPPAGGRRSPPTMLSVRSRRAETKSR